MIKKMETTTMTRPETVALTYDKSNPMAKKTLNFILSLGLFQVDKTAKSKITKDDTFMSKEELDAVIEQGLHDRKEGRGREITIEQVNKLLGI